MPSWPTGVQTTTITFGKGITVDGNVTSATLTITPIFSGTKAVKWATDSTPLLPFVITALATAGAYGSVQLPVVDQAGWKDDGQHDYSLWAYKLEELPMYGTTIGAVRTKYVQPLTGQTSIDFDDIPDGSVGLPASAPVVPVSSVAGLTGDVTVDELAQAGVGGVTDAGVNAILTDPTSASATSLSATYVTRLVLCALGNSITAGALSSSPATSWVGQLPAKVADQLGTLSGTLTVVNEGNGGDRTFEFVNRAGAAIAASKPTMCLVLPSINDRKSNEYGLTPAVTIQNMKRLIGMLRLSGVQPIIATEAVINVAILQAATGPSMPEFTIASEYDRRRVNAAIRVMVNGGTDTSGIAGVVPGLWAGIPLADVDAAIDNDVSYTGASGLHPGDAGHAIYAYATAQGIGGLPTTVWGAPHVLPTLGADDEFARADSSTSMGGSWVVQTGTWGIASGRAVSVSAGTWDNTSLDTAVTDHAAVAVGVAPTPGAAYSVGVTTRRSGGDHYLALLEVAADRSAHLKFYSVAAGPAPTQIADFPIPAGMLTDTSEVTLASVGSVHTACVNGMTLLQITDTTFTAGTQVGLEVVGSLAPIESFSWYRN